MSEQPKTPQFQSEEAVENTLNAEAGETPEVQDETLTEQEEELAASQPEINAITAEQADALRQEAAEAKDKYVRLVAEFDNFRRRNAKERQELMQTAGKDIISSLLVVLDDSIRAGKTIETSTDLEQVKEGVRLVFNKLHKTLEQKGLKEMNAKGEEFDPELHEAITEIPAPGEDLVGKVVDVVEAGYYLNDKLIRHAKVVVGK